MSAGSLCVIGDYPRQKNEPALTKCLFCLKKTVRNDSSEFLFNRVIIKQRGWIMKKLKLVITLFGEAVNPVPWITRTAKRGCHVSVPFMIRFVSFVVWFGAPLIRYNQNQCVCLSSQERSSLILGISVYLRPIPPIPVKASSFPVLSDAAMPAERNFCSRISFIGKD